MTKLAGICNLTPDSFSGDGILSDPITRIAQLVADGAEVVDIGAESTRPGATPLLWEEEWARLKNILRDARREFPQVILSIDTRHPETAARALEKGADWINDVSGFNNSAMVEAVAHTPCQLVVMHALTVPTDPAHTLPADVDPVMVVRDFFVNQMMRLEEAGISRNRVILDPGIGFGKTSAQSWALIQRAQELRVENLPLLFGHSRKSFLRTVTANAAPDRDGETLEVSVQLVEAGVEYLRVHDVAGHRAILYK